MIRGIHHVAISTPDLERTVTFYREVLGGEVVPEASVAWRVGWETVDRILGLDGSSADVALIRFGNLYIEFFEYHSPEPRPADGPRRPNDHGLAHIALDVDDVQEEYTRMKALGMQFIEEPLRVGEGLPVSAYGRDPDGNLVELQETYPSTSPMHLRARPVTGAGA